MVKDADGNDVNPAADAPLVAQVWRSINDPFVGIDAGAGVGRHAEGKERTVQFHAGPEGDGGDVSAEWQEAGYDAGRHTRDIVALAKLKTTVLNDTLCSPGQSVRMAPIVFPNPVVSFAVSPKNQGDEDKLGQGLQRVAEDDPTIHVQRQDETNELIITGMGDVQIDAAMERMKARSKVEVTLSTPKVPGNRHRWAKGTQAQKQWRRGRYGEVYLRIGR